MDHSKGPWLPIQRHIQGLAVGDISYPNGPGFHMRIRATTLFVLKTLIWLAVVQISDLHMDHTGISISHHHSLSEPNVQLSSVDVFGPVYQVKKATLDDGNGLAAFKSLAEQLHFRSQGCGFKLLNPKCYLNTTNTECNLTTYHFLSIDCCHWLDLLMNS